MITLRLPRAIDDDLAADLEKQAIYVSPFVTSVRVTTDRTSVEIEHQGGEAAEIEDKVARFVSAMAGKFRKIPRKVIFRSERQGRGPIGRGTYEELVKRRWVLELGRGQLGFSGPALACAQMIDSRGTRLAKEVFGAVEESYPVLIPADILARCGYFSSFPHAVSMVAHLVEDFDLIEEFQRANAGNPGLTLPRPDVLGKPEACLTPAVCYHCYQSLEGRTLGPEGHCVTALGRCFRYESRNIVSLERLWDFSMREVIFVGTEEFVTKGRARGIELLSAQMNEWDLDCIIETANDPFFSTTYATKTYWQTRGDLKYELRLAVGEGASPGDDARRIACGSFNLHENFFGKTFGITAADGQPAFTGCFAWGIERVVLALFSQHGTEPSQWPAGLRGDVFGA